VNGTLSYGGKERGSTMFTRQTVGAFIAGGVLVGGIAFAGVAHGAITNSGTTSTGQSDAQYTAKHAWAQSIPTANTPTTLSIPTGERLTITDATDEGDQTTCTVSATLNGVSVPYAITSQQDGATAATFQPIYVDSGTAACGGDGAILVGYLTPVPAE
jgi:hypothetical protein